MATNLRSRKNAVSETMVAYARRVALVIALASAMFALFVGLSVGEDESGRGAPAVPPSAARNTVEAPAPPLVVVPEPARPVVAPEPARPVVAPDGVRIPAIGVDAPLIPLGLNPDRTLAVPTKAKIAGWYTGAPTPGEVGPAIVVGHVDWRGELGVFKRLDQLRPGDQVEFSSGDDVTTTFAVTRSERVSKEAFPTQRVYGDTAGPELRLITCGGVFDRSSGHYRDNVIVYANVVRQTQ